MNAGEKRRPSRDRVLRRTEPLLGFPGAPPPAEKKQVLVQEAEELLSLSWGGPSPAPAAPPSLRGSTPTPTPRPAASCHLLLPSCITESPQALNPLLRLRTGASQESICSFYSGPDPPRGGPIAPGSRSPEEGLCFLTALRGCRQTSFLRSPPASEPAAHTDLRTRVPAPISSWSPQLGACTPAQAHPSPGTSTQGRAAQ